MKAVDPLGSRLLPLGDSGVGLPDAIGAFDPLCLTLDPVALLADGLTLGPLGLAFDPLRALNPLSLTLDPLRALDPLGLTLNALRTLDPLGLPFGTLRTLGPRRLALARSLLTGLRPLLSNLGAVWPLGAHSVAAIALRRSLTVVLVAVSALAAGRG